MAEPTAFISDYEHEQFRPREAEALQLLKKVGSLVTPILKQRAWTIDVLSEFYIPQNGLLGLIWGRGQIVFLCLRKHDCEHEFRTLENLIDTMLHELGHMVHDGHGLRFCLLWRQLRQEFKDLDQEADDPPRPAIQET